MISAFLGMVFADVRSGLKGFIPIFVLLVSAGLMGICGLLIKKLKWQWLETYAMSISMVGAMIFAVVITPMII
jgi:Kef-type K+ transport system membrane component KefB